MLSGLAATARTPPLPDVDRFRCAKWSGVVVMRGVLVHSDIRRAVQRDERVVRQVDLVDLVKDLLAGGWVRRCLFLSEQLIQRRVTVEVDIEASRRELVAGEQRRVVGVIRQGILELANVIPSGYSARGRRRAAAAQERAEEGAGRIVLDVELNANGLKVRLQDQLVIGAPEVVSGRRVIELQAHIALCTHAICARLPAVLIQQGIGASNIKLG